MKVKAYWIYNERKIYPQELPYESEEELPDDFDRCYLCQRAFYYGTLRETKDKTATYCADCRPELYKWGEK